MSRKAFWRCGAFEALTIQSHPLAPTWQLTQGRLHPASLLNLSVYTQIWQPVITEGNSSFQFIFSENLNCTSLGISDLCGEDIVSYCCATSSPQVQYLRFSSWEGKCLLWTQVNRLVFYPHIIFSIMLDLCPIRIYNGLTSWENSC